MARHSKRNTASSYFTAYERSLLSHYGRQKQRLTSDSFREFDTCNLCLMPARDPVCCPDQGHIFCRECIVENLLAQLNEIKQLNKEIALKHEEELRKEAEEEEKAREREIAEFESLQSGIGGGSKRKFKIEYDEHERITGESKDKIRKLLREEELEASKAKHASFWVPSLTPYAEKSTSNEAPKLSPVCPASDHDHTHSLSLKTLVSLSFEERELSEKTARVCPSCTKPFGTVLDAYLTKPCGHAICKTCYDKVMKPQHSGEKLCCFVCSEDLSEAAKSKSKSGKKIGRGVIFLPREGTGFSGGGKAVVEKAGVAFQA